MYLINGNMLPLNRAGAFAGDEGKEKEPNEEILEVEERGEKPKRRGSDRTHPIP